MSMNFQNLELEIQGKVATVWLNRPPVRNALIAPRESAQLAEQLIADTVVKQNIAPGTLTLHADRSTSMRSKTVAELLADLEVTPLFTQVIIDTEKLKARQM